MDVLITTTAQARRLYREIRTASGLRGADFDSRARVHHLALQERWLQGPWMWVRAAQLTLQEAKASSRSEAAA